MLKAIIYRDFKLAKEDKFFYLAPFYTLAGLVGDYACYMLVLGYITTVVGHKNFKYNGDILLNTIADSRKKLIVSNFLSPLVYIPIYFVMLFLMKYLLSNIIPSYNYIFNMQYAILDICVAISFFSILFFILIKFGVSKANFLYTILIMVLSGLGIFQKNIDIYNSNYILPCSIALTGVMLWFCIKDYENKDF